MRTLLWLAGLALFCPAVATATQARPDDKAEARKKAARAFVEALVREDFKTAAAANFDETVKKLSSQEKLKEFWDVLTKKIGKFQKIEGVGTEKVGKYEVVRLTCAFAEMKLDFRVVFDAEQRIAGYHLAAPKVAHAFKPPSYARPASFREVELKLNAGGDWPLSATLTIPNGDGPFPVVVLVHGSGPHDRDETLGPNKVFRDLAWGLASQGVAVLRYNKRNHEHGPKLVGMIDRLTVKEEAIDDAVAAAALVRGQKRIDPGRVFVLGHSLGGYVAPRIAQADPKLAGIILLAGNTRPLEDLVIDQFTYLFGLGGKISEENQKELDKIKKQVARVKGDLPADTPRSDLPLGIPPAYWRDLKTYNPAATATRLKTRILVLQGERDYQVTMADFAGWQKALKGRPNATLKSYPALNHLFMEGKGKGTPAEYQKEGHVAREVIDDVAAWVKKR